MSNLSFDEILETKIRTGKYTWILFTTMFLCNFNEGIFVYLIPALNPLLKKSFNMNESELDFTYSCSYIG